MMTKLNKKEEGFTLIELLVVILIIGILSAIAIPAFLSQRTKAWQASANTSARNAALLIESIKTGNGGVPPAAAPAADPEKSEWEKIAPSGGNIELVYKAAGNEFKVCATDKRLTSGTPDADTAVYDSANGGLQKALVGKTNACS